MADNDNPVLFLSGNEAVARAALDARIKFGVGYPGTPSTEILESFSDIGGRAQWSPNEKVALEVGIGSSFGATRTLVTMKHVGVNVAADALFTVAYTGVDAALVLVSADDPGMASSQNEQDNRRYAVAAGIPMLEPSDSQEAYDFMVKAVEISESWGTPVILRLTTRVCHSKTVVQLRTMPETIEIQPQAEFVRDVKRRVMIPGYARAAHKRLRAKLADLEKFNETFDINTRSEAVGKDKDGKTLGIISSGIAAMHAREAAPEAAHLKLAMTYPLPMKLIADFVNSVDRCVVLEEGDPYLVDAVRAAGLDVEGKDEMYRFGELNVERVRRILAGDTSPEAAPAPGKPPQLCKGCPHRSVFNVLRDMGCIVAGDIGCYTLGVLPPFEAIDTCVCMGASIGVALGLRHVLPRAQAKDVVSVIGDSTFMHSGITGLVEMVYNRPETGHVVLILDNGTTAMTGMQEHPGTGRALDHAPAGRVSMEKLAESLGIENVSVCDPTADIDAFRQQMQKALAADELSVIITRRPCLLAAGKINQYEKDNAAKQS